MEIPQLRAFGSEARKSTHDFLSLYSHPTSQQDPRPPSQDNYLKTHDFLRPLERGERTSSSKDEVAEDKSVDERQPPPAPPASVEHVLPGGIGTYTISHISYVNQRAPKPEGSIFAVAQSTSMDRNDESSNCSSYTGSGFTLWEDSATKKRNAGKENMARPPSIGEPGSMASQWVPASERPSQSSSNTIHTSHTSYSSPRITGLKNQSFIDFINSAKVCTHEEDVDTAEEFLIKSESKTALKDDLTVKVDGKSAEQKPNTPRSKHSATEQRRRSKINDRFQMLRELIPRTDQKRDKASFLLEVIEYIHFLQEKVRKYEGSFQGSKHEPEKLIPWRNNPRAGESFVDHSCGVKNGSTPAFLFAGRLDEKNVTASPAIPRIAQNQAESEMKNATNLKASDQYPGTTAMTLAVPLQPDFFTLGCGGVVSELPPRLASESTPQPQLKQCQAYTSGTDANSSGDNLKRKDLSIEGGTISISSICSQGLLNTLTQALRNSGVDLSRASISVQIELGKRATISSQKLCRKEGEIPACNQVMTCSAVASRAESEQPLKKLRKGKS